jgi:hypothetical protein
VGAEARWRRRRWSERRTECAADGEAGRETDREAEDACTLGQAVFRAVGLDAVDSAVGLPVAAVAVGCGSERQRARFERAQADGDAAAERDAAVAVDLPVREHEQWRLEGRRVILFVPCKGPLCSST